MALIATVGAADANSYVTAVEFATYLLSRPFVPTSVTAASIASREAALIMATRMMDAKQCFTGAAASATQSLQWPRSGMLSATGFALGSDVLPVQLKDSICEVAIAMLVSDILADNDVSVQGITSISAGPVSLSFKDTIEARGLPATALALLPSSWKCENTVDENDATSFLFEVYNGEEA